MTRMTSGNDAEVGAVQGHHGDAKDGRHLVEALDGGAGGVGALGLVFEIARGSGYVMTSPTGVDWPGSFGE